MTDLYEESMAPRKYERGTLYHVAAPRHEYTATLLVDTMGYCELFDWHWGNNHKNTSVVMEERYKIEREIWEWLTEWEFVELRAIGPEDSEYFATEKLTGTS